MTKYRWWIIVPVIVIIGQSLFSAYRIAFTGHLFDLHYFIRAGDNLIHHTTIYQSGDFNYLAWVVPLFIPLSIVSVPVAQIIFLTLSISALVLSTYLVFKLINWPIFSWRWWAVCGLVFASFPVKFTLGMGQVNTFLLLVIVSGLSMLTTRPAVSGILLGLATLLKITPGILIVALLINRRLITIASMVVTTLTGVCISTLLVGREGMIQLVSQLLSNTNLAGKTIYYNQAYSGFLTRLWSAVPASIWFCGVAVFLAVTVLITFRNKADHLLTYCLWIMAILIINPYTWQHHLILTVLPLITLADRAKTRRDWIALIVAYLLISFNFHHPEWLVGTLFGTTLLSHGFIGCVILWVLLVRQITQN